MAAVEFERLFREALAKYVSKALKHGMKPPLLVTAVARSHSVLVMSFADGLPGELEPTLVAEHTKGERFDPPVNFFIVDSAGVTAAADFDPARYWPASVN
jgi:hypothetical protein